MEDDEGPRERKRRQTRAKIADAAMDLFREHGFDQVSVRAIAEAAGVAEKTVYNHYPTKAAMFFDEGDDLLTELLTAVANRAPGDSALGAVRTFVNGMGEWADHRRPSRPGREYRRLIAESPTLQAHRRAMFARYEAALGEVLVQETCAPAGSVEPFLAAACLVAVLRVAFEVGSGDSSVPDTERALGLLARGLDGYAVRPPR